VINLSVRRATTSRGDILRFPPADFRHRTPSSGSVSPLGSAHQVEAATTLTQGARTCSGWQADCPEPRCRTSCLCRESRHDRTPITTYFPFILYDGQSESTAGGADTRAAR
jgi:hypothetical protein